MLHDAEARHHQLRRKLRQRAAVTREEPVEQETTRRVGERLEHAVVVGHAQIIRDHKVTYQAPTGPSSLALSSELFATRCGAAKRGRRGPRAVSQWVSGS